MLGDWGVEGAKRFKKERGAWERWKEEGRMKRSGEGREGLGRPHAQGAGSTWEEVEVVTASLASEPSA